MTFYNLLFENSWGMVDEKEVASVLSKALIAKGGDGHIEACLFDMDGVLLDSMPSHSVSWVQAIETVQIKETPNYFYQCEGQVGRETIINLFQQHKNRFPTKDEIEKVYSLKCSLFDDHDKHLAVDYAVEMISDLVDRKLPIFLVTGSGHPSLKSRLQTLFGDIWSDQNIISASDVKFGKPHPEPYLKALERAQKEANRCLVIENAPLGIKSATAADLAVLAVNTGPLSEEELLRAGAVSVLSNLRQIHTIIKSLL